jgi:hypothetical protein
VSLLKLIEQPRHPPLQPTLSNIPPSIKLLHQRSDVRRPVEQAFSRLCTRGEASPSQAPCSPRSHVHPVLLRRLVEQVLNERRSLHLRAAWLTPTAHADPDSSAVTADPGCWPRSVVWASSLEQSALGRSSGPALGQQWESVMGQ